VARHTAVVLAICLVCSTVAGTGVAVAGVGPAGPSIGGESVAENSTVGPVDAPEKPRIVALYPNPVAGRDAGEYVRLWLPPESGPLVLIDDRASVRLPANTSGRVVVTDDPGAVRVPSETQLVAAPGLGLANGGDRVQLESANGSVRETATYDSAPEGERWITAASEWRPLGYEPREPRPYDGSEATVFTLPDAPEVPRSTLRDAEQRILLAGYTLTSDRIVRALLAAHDRGATVRVLLERSPIDGMSRSQAGALDRLADAGVEVTLLGGPRSRFAYHHAKYAVVDDQALVLTENWKPAGTGGHSSRGWGVRTSDPEIADDLAALFGSDANGVDATPWSAYRRGRTFDSAQSATAEYPQEIEPETVRLDAARLLTAPGNAEREMVREIDSAEKRVVTLQPTIQRESALVRASLRAAARGVEVRILLSDAWYAVEQNREHVTALNDHAERRDLPLTARVDDPRGQYGKIHAKGLVVDDRTAYVSSLNWNSQAGSRNREVALELQGEAVAGYFAAAFEADWKRSGQRIPIGVASVAVLAAVVAALVARRRISFGDGRPLAAVDGDEEADETAAEEWR
jgi:phosphatidylserine/phosphatidylglycerophosphate/cardiolipin synthase-like enzyme